MRDTSLNGVWGWPQFARKREPQPCRASREARSRRHPVLLAALALLLSACSLRVDEGEARLCRLAIAGLHADATTITIRTTRRETSAPAQALPFATSAVAIDYTARAGGRDEPHRIVCRFDAAHGPDITPNALVAIETAEGPLPATRLYMLRRFWLASPDGARADPEPVAAPRTGPALPRGLAIALQVVVAGLPQTCLYALLSGAYALIYGLIGRANLAFGDIAALGGYGAILGLTAVGTGGGAALPVAVALLVAAWAAGFAASVAGRRVFAPLVAETGQAPLIASASLAVLIAEATRLAQGNSGLSAPALLNTPIALAHADGMTVTITPMTAAVAAGSIACTLVLIALMHRSRFGRRWRAVADDPGAAALMGIDARHLAGLTFALAGLMAGLAGAVSALAFGSVSHGYGLLAGLKALLAAILGGAGSIGGGITAGLLIGIVETAWGGAVALEHREAAIFAMLVMALVLRPGGFFGRPDLEPDRQ